MNDGHVALPRISESSLEHSQRLVVGQLTGSKGPAPGLVADRRESGDRRTHSLHSFAYGSVRPRRRVGRRAGDDHNIFLDWHEPRVLYLVLAILLMSCTDALLTLNILAIGGQELNGFMDWLIARDVGQFVSVKIGITAVSLVALVVVAQRHFLGRIRVIRLMQLFCAGYAVLIGYELMLIIAFVSRSLAEGQSVWTALFG